MRTVTFVRIPTEDAGPRIRELMARGVVDLHAKISKDEG